MDILIELAKVGFTGLVAAIFYKLYLDEKKAHAVTQAALVQAILDRLADSKEDSRNNNATLREVTSTIQTLTTKIEYGKGR